MHMLLTCRSHVTCVDWHMRKQEKVSSVCNLSYVCVIYEANYRCTCSSNANASPMTLNVPIHSDVQLSFNEWPNACMHTDIQKGETEQNKMYSLVLFDFYHGSTHVGLILRRYACI